MIVKDGIQLVEFIGTLLPIVEYFSIYQKLLPGKMTEKYDLFHCFLRHFFYESKIFQMMAMPQTGDDQ